MTFSAITIKRAVSKKGNQLFFVDNIDDEPLSRRLLSRFLNKAMGIQIEEIAFMYEDFRINPEKKIAHFGVNGYFMYSE